MTPTLARPGLKLTKYPKTRGWIGALSRCWTRGGTDD